MVNFPLATPSEGEMTMPYDGFVMAAIRSELEREIIGGRIERIYQPSPLEITLLIHRPGNRWRLLLSAHPQNARVHLTTKVKENPLSPPLFCMVLRKHLEGGRIQKIHQPGLERVLVFHIQGWDDIGEPAPRELICEVMGRHSNIILVDPQANQIIDAIKRYTHAVSRHREVLPGREYVPPPKLPKLNPLTAEEEAFYHCLLQGSLESPVAVALQHCLHGVSLLTARETVYRAGLPPDMTLDQCGEYELSRLWVTAKQMALQAFKGEFSPSMVVDEQGHPVEVAAFDLTHLHPLPRRHGPMNLLVDLFYGAIEEREERMRLSQSLLAVVKREIKHLSGVISLQEERLAQAEKADQYRIFGELLMANLTRLGKGAKEVEVENFYDPEGKPVTILLDPGLTPLENAQAYFKKYTKAKQTSEEAKKRLANCQSELEYLLGVETAINLATTKEELAEIRQELEEQGYLKPAGKEKKREQTKPQPIVFTSSDGFTILVGKNNRQNDYLVTRLAREEDLWLHAKDVPGSHVIVRTQGQPVPETTLLEAAALAAYFSRSRQSSKVAVDYTLIKNVRKPRGARPGYVTYTGQRTVVVKPQLLTLPQQSSPGPGEFPDRG